MNHLPNIVQPVLPERPQGAYGTGAHFNAVARRVRGGGRDYGRLGDPNQRRHSPPAVCVPLPEDRQRALGQGAVAVFAVWRGGGRRGEEEKRRRGEEEKRRRKNQEERKREPRRENQEEREENRREPRRGVSGEMEGRKYRGVHFSPCFFNVSATSRQLRDKNTGGSFFSPFSPFLPPPLAPLAPPLAPPSCPNAWPPNPALPLSVK
jgi:hypothetical protein